MRLNQLARKLNVSTQTIVRYLDKKGVSIQNNPNTKLSPKQVQLLTESLVGFRKTTSRPPSTLPESPTLPEKVDFATIPTPLKETPKPAPHPPLSAPLKLTTIGKIDLPTAPSKPKPSKNKIFRKRIIPSSAAPSKPTKSYSNSPKSAYYKPTAKRTKRKKKTHQIQSSSIKVTPFINIQDLALLFDVSKEKLLEVCQNLGLEVSITQRLQPEVITLLADEFKKEVVFIDMETPNNTQEEDAEHLTAKTPVVVVMGHVDHGKTSLLDYIRNTKVANKEAGGITQHIGAYQVVTGKGEKITFIDTPGHEAFTAMRARGAEITDIAIIVIAADDGVMPQTREAIKHAQVAGIPIVFALNKIDKPKADPEKVKTQLTQMDIIVEDFGGKYQSENISTKTGEGIDNLLEKVLLEANMLELKANPIKPAKGIVIEASLQKQIGYLITVIVQEGTLKVGNIVAAGPYYGKLKAMFDFFHQPLKEAAPATPVQILGINGAPQAGQAFYTVESEQTARQAAEKYEQILVDQQQRARSGTVLHRFQDDLAEEKTKTINIILKGDTDGSIEALADTLPLLSNKEVTVQILYKAVGPIFESDILLAATTNALVIGFQTKIDVKARKVIEEKQILVKQFNIIYEAIDYVKERVLNQNIPKEEEVFLGSADVVKIFHISRVGTIAGCIVRKGLIKRKGQVKLIRDKQVLYMGSIKQLKHEKQSIGKALTSTECGISLPNFNDIVEGDVIECFEYITRDK